MTTASQDGNERFGYAQLYAAAKLYYEDEATQAEIAAHLGTSRATVSRLLSEARRRGVVEIRVIPPSAVGDDLAPRLAAALGLRRVELAAGSLRPSEDADAAIRALAPAVGRALQAVGLEAGDVLLVAAGRAMYGIARELPPIPGLIVAPAVGGDPQPEGWFQTNEIARMVATATGGRASYLFAPALPGPELYAGLVQDRAIQRVLDLWPQARCLLLGVGAAPAVRPDTPHFMREAAASLRTAAGDLCTRFFDRQGEPLPFEGSDRLIALELAAVRAIPDVIAVATGAIKVDPVIVAARAGYLDTLVTDVATAELIMNRLAGGR